MRKLGRSHTHKGYSSHHLHTVMVASGTEHKLSTVVVLGWDISASALLAATPVAKSSF